jgi:hypothetical protein
VTTIGEFNAGLLTADAAQYLLELSPNDVAYLEDPYAEGTGMVYRFSPYDIIGVEESYLGQLRTYAGTRRVRGIATFPNIFILEGSEMKAARG